jgi:hypothetical protein
MRPYLKKKKTHHKNRAGRVPQDEFKPPIPFKKDIKINKSKYRKKLSNHKGEYKKMKKMTKDKTHIE